MKTATINEIKQELASVSPATITALCLRLARYKKENKELLTYLLFESNDEPGYIEGVKKEMDCWFIEINKSTPYFAKKGLRKILRTTNKYIRYTGSLVAEIDLLLYYCNKLVDSGIPLKTGFLFKKNTAIANLYDTQVKKISKLITGLHEDLQYEYVKKLETLLNQS